MAAAAGFPYAPNGYETEKASNSYLMSLIVVMIGLPLPIVNLIASAIFFAGNRKGAYFVRWHCMQMLLTQVVTLFVNAEGVYWTLAIILGRRSITNQYIAYIITILLFNFIEFIATIYAAVRTRKGNHVVWWLFGPLADIFVRP
jgi:hypothetical protein